MIRIFVAVVLLATSFLFTFGQVKHAVANKDSKVIDELIKLDQALTAAEKRKDFATINRLVGDDYTDTTALGRVRSRADYLAEVGPYESGGRESNDYEVRVYGKFAVMTHRTALKNPDYQFRSTHVWMRRDGHWQVISSHYSVIRPEKK